MTERRKIDWSVEHIIHGAGISLEDADDYIIALAEQCRERCYYIDRASEELIRLVRGSR